MDNKHVLDALIKDLEQSENKQLPPVNDWNPDLSGDIDIRIDREGNWFHEGEKFQRQALVNLFSSILKMEGDPVLRKQVLLPIHLLKEHKGLNPNQFEDLPSSECLLKQILVKSYYVCLKKASHQ